MIGGSNNEPQKIIKDKFLRLELSIDNSQPPPINIKKFMDKYKNEQEQYKTINISYKYIDYTFKIYYDDEIAYYYYFRQFKKQIYFY